MAEPSEIETQMQQFLRSRLSTDGIICEIVDRGSRGVLVAMPNGRIISVVARIASHSILTKLTEDGP